MTTGPEPQTPGRPRSDGGPQLPGRPQPHGGPQPSTAESSSDPGRTRMEGKDPRAPRPAYRGLQKSLFDLLQVPLDPPEAPPGRSEWTRAFRPDPAYLSYMRLGALLMLLILGPLLLVVVGLIMAGSEFHVVGVLVALLVLLGGAVLLLSQLIGIRLGYDATWYVMTDEAVRNRRGLWIVKENTVSFDNVQNLSIRQGPIQRYFGIEDLVVETAASGAAVSNDEGSQAQSLQIVGIRNAAELRDRIAQRMRLTGGTGLGRSAHGSASPDGPPVRDASTPGQSSPDRSTGPRGSGGSSRGAAPILGPAHLALLREIRDEVRQLSQG